MRSPRRRDRRRPRDPSGNGADPHPLDLEAAYESDESGPIDIAVGRYDASYHSPDTSNPLARLYVDTGAEFPVAFIGWGLKPEAFASFAEGVVASTRRSDEVDGMTAVFDGVLGDYVPGTAVFPAYLSIWYYTGEDYSMANYRVLNTADQPPLEAYAWARPGPTFTTTDGDAASAVTFPASAFHGTTDQTMVIRQIDENTTVSWSSIGNPPISPDELAEIELTPAAADDPRWDEIAWESGMYDAVG